MVKSIIDIEVNDAAFKQFNALFQQYTQQLKGMPIAWRQIAIAQAGGIKGFQDLVKEQAIAIGQQRLMAEAHKSALNLLRAQETIWQNIRRQTTGVAVNIRDMTTEFLQWSKATAAIGGLLGAGGLFGIERLAQGVSTERRSALGLGVTYGQQKAFGNAFERFADPRGVAGGRRGSPDRPDQARSADAGRGDRLFREQFRPSPSGRCWRSSARPRPAPRSFWAPSTGYLAPVARS